MQSANAYLELIRERGKRGLPLQRVYRHLFNPGLYLSAYGKIYRNTGAMTKGVTNETPDGMSLDKIGTIIQALRCERYHWKPARRTYIPKKNGKQRPLGMPVWSDKVLQEVIRQILEAYFEPTFSDHSHGFRPRRGCHTALREIYHNWVGTTWFIEGDISQCFDKLDHELLLTTLSERIHDGRLLHLMRELLNAGYLEDWKFNKTLSGVPQGGVVSPILSNILLDKLDKYVETTLIPKYTKGDKKRRNREYIRLMNHAHYQRKRGKAPLAKRLSQQAKQMPSIDPQDPEYRRLKYVRYADDFLLGFVGPRSEAEEIKQQIGQFLRDELKLELSHTKTLITHARREAARFLGYEITTIHDDAKHCLKRDGTRGRSVNGRIGLRVPRDVLVSKWQRYQRGKKARHRSELLDASDYTIVSTYQLEFRGLTNYYRLAYNLHILNRLKYVMECSLTKTLARKFKLSVPKVYERYGAEFDEDGKRYKGLQVTVPRPEKPPLVARWGGISLTWDIQATLEEQPARLWTGRSELIDRLLAGYCELCGSTDDIQVHHVRAMKHLHQYPGHEKPVWVKRMIALRRKTLPLCRTCHEDVHAGRPLRRQTIKLADVKALQKRARQRY